MSRVLGEPPPLCMTERLYHLALARLDPVDAKHRHEDLIGVANCRMRSRPGKKIALGLQCSQTSSRHSTLHSLSRSL